MMKRRRKIPKFIIKLDTDSPEVIKKFIKQWEELNTEIVYIPKSCKTYIRGMKK